MQKLRAAVIGVRHGHIAEFFSAVQDVEGVELVSVAEDESRLAAQAAATWGVPVYPDYRRLLEGARPDVVGVAAVNARKGAIIADCLQRGVHAIADKPLVTTFDDLARVRAAVGLGRARLSLMLTCRFHPGFRAVRTLIEDGSLGEVVHLATFGPHRLRPATRGPWQLNDADGGGILVDLGVHYVDLLRWYVGEEPRRLAAAHGNRRFRQFADFTDHGHVFLEFPGGAAGYVSVDWLTPEAAPYHGDYRLFVTGTRGYCEFRVAQPYELFLVTDDRPLCQVDLPPAGSTSCQDFLLAVRDGHDPALPVEEVLRATELTLWARDAATTGQCVDIDARRH
jgi:predicted dehydrogenase